MYTIGLSMRLKPGAHADYRRAHDELWPEVAASMADNGVSMAIYRSGRSGLLFVFAAAPDEAAWRASRDAPALERWNAEMTRYLETDADGAIAFEQLDKAFGFGDFA